MNEIIEKVLEEQLPIIEKHAADADAERYDSYVGSLYQIYRVLPQSEAAREALERLAERLGARAAAVIDSEDYSAYMEILLHLATDVPDSVRIKRTLEEQLLLLSERVRGDISAEDYEFVLLWIKEIVFALKTNKADA